MIRIEFNRDEYAPTLYSGRHLEIREVGSQIRYYEVDRIHNKEYCLLKETIEWLIHKGSIPRKQIIVRALKGDKTIFNS